MSQQVTIQITAKDGASQAFQAVGKSAQGMSSTAQQATKNAASGFGQIDKAAQTTESKIQGLGKGFDVVKGAAAGLVGSAVVGFLSDSARAAADSEAVMARLGSAVETAGGNFEILGPAIDTATGAAEQLAFDGEDAADALTTLTQRTGDAGQAIDLLGLTMDVARGRGVSLASAADAVGKAAAGNVSALQKMGVAIEEGATAQEALAAAQATFGGQAEAYAGTTQGAFDKLAVTFGNVQETIGGMLGPMQVVVGILPGLSSGFGMLSGTVGGLQGAGGLGALVATMNPLALGIGAVTVGVGLLVGAFVVAEKGAKDLADSLIGVQTALSDVTFLSLNEELGNLAVSAEEVGAIRIDGWLWEADGKVATFNRTLGETVNVLQDTGSSVGEFSLVFGQLDAALLGKDVTLNQNTKALQDYRTVLENTGPGAAAATSQLGILNRAFISGVMGPEEYQAAIGELVTTLPMFDDAAVESAGNVAAAQREMTTSIVGTRQEFDNYVVSAGNRIRSDEILAERATASAAAEAKRLAGIVSAAPTTDRYTASIAANSEALRLQGAAILADAAAQDALVASLRGNLIPALLEVPGRLQEIVLAGEDYLDVLGRMSGSTSIGIADDLNDAQQALSGTLGAMEQIAALNDPIEKAVSVVDDLMAPLGEAGELESWMVRATDAITNGGTALGLFGDTLTNVSQVQAEYSAVLGGQVQLTDANARAQQAVNEMMLAQVPLVGDQASSLADYIEQLRTLGPEEQQRALYLMDSANAAKVAAAQATIFSASMGEIPETVASDIILNAAQADPVLAGILEDMGYISTNPATGEIMVTIPDSSQMALDKFEALFSGSDVREANGLIYVTDDAGNTLVYDQFNNLVDKQVTATVTVNVNDPEQMLSRGGGGAAANNNNAYGISDSVADVTVGISADATEFDRILAESQAAAQEWVSTTYTTTVAATDEATAVVDTAQTVATTYAAGPYNAPIEATDNASVVVDTAETNATTYATGTYNAAIEATDNGSTVIATVQSGADAFASVYVGELQADDLASTIIANVQTALTGLDGDRATVYVDVVQNAPIPGYAQGGGVRATPVGDAMRLGGTVQSRSVQAAALGRTVLVGEAGPELAFLPYGTQVMPSTASESRGREDARGGGMRFYAPVHIHASSPDIAREIERQFATRSRA